jgi:hypothetical protein
MQFSKRAQVILEKRSRLCQLCQSKPATTKAVAGGNWSPRNRPRHTVVRLCNSCSTKHAQVNKLIWGGNHE